MKLYSIQTSQLPIIETGQFIIRYLTDFDSLALNSSDDVVFQELHDSLKAQSPTYNLALSQIQAQAETLTLKKQDEIRDKKISVLRRALSVYQHSDIAQEAEAFAKIKIALKNYKNLEKLNFEAETLAIDNLVADLRSAVNLPLLQTLSMEAVVDNLQTANADFKKTFNSRSSDKISTQVYDTKALKKEMLATYNDLTQYVLVMAKRRNTPYYSSILSAINHGREYYANILAHRSGTASKAAAAAKN